MKVEITSKQNVRVEGREYLLGQVVDKQEDENVKKAWIESGVAKPIEEKPLKNV
jgi:hypothetical protein